MRSLVAAVLAVAALAAAPVAAADEFNTGTAAAEITPTSALVWARAAHPGEALVRWYPRSGKPRREARINATAERDLTVQLRLTGLRPDTVYRYQFAQGAASSQIGSFRTAPRPSASRRVRFTYSGDADAQPATPGGPPVYNQFEAYGRMAAERGDFAINLGDTIYSDTEVGSSAAGGVFTPASPPALTVQEKWAKYSMNLGMPNLVRLRSTTGMYNHWDDHEFINDFSRQGYGGEVYGAGVQAFRDYMPVTFTEERGIYRRFRWGKHLELFFPDERSFRSTDSKAACINPSTGVPDLAPTLPQSTRNAFALVSPSLEAPVSGSCVAAINDPARTMLGAAQLARLLGDVKRSKATFKVIVNEVPLQQLYIFPYDSWEGYGAERAKLIAGLRGVRNVVVLTTDTHASLIGEVRSDTLGKTRRSGIMEAITGPVATRTYTAEIGAALGSTGAADTIETAFLQPTPPTGLGLPCANLDVYSYGLVEVTAKKLTVRLKDQRGKPVRNVGSGPACKPLVVKAR
jgi:phosphodiesterase/alkaline phosphatase D-like protein